MENTERKYTKEEMRMMFEAGFNSYSDIDRNFDPSETEVIEKEKQEQFELYLVNLIIN